MLPFKDTKSNYQASYKDIASVLVISEDQKFARDFARFASHMGLEAQYAWSLEGLDFLPLWHVGTAIISEEAWASQKLYGSAVRNTLKSFLKVFVVKKENEEKKFVSGASKEDIEFEYIQEEDIQKTLGQLVREKATGQLDE
ncbi:MAG: hypothetical protein R3B45_06100 [Bdellovibrionota bacterium]